MADHQWRSALGRWGDLLWQVALLRSGDRAAAQRTLVAAFSHAFAAPPADAQHALLEALLHPPRRRLPTLNRARALPRPLRRLSPSTRGLLALWLVHAYDGPQLAASAHCSRQALADQIVMALMTLVPRQDGTRRTAAGQAAFAEWVKQQLGFQAATVQEAVLEAHGAAWQAAVDRVRVLLVEAVGGQRLPGVAREAIEAEMTAVGEEAPGWQRWAGGIAIGAVLLMLVVILWPKTPVRVDRTTTAAVVEARALVQQTLDAWTTAPISGTLHRRVWSIDPYASDKQSNALLTNVWLASDNERYRIETHSEGKLVEWQVVDNGGRLHTGAEPAQHPCQWAFNALDHRVHTFTLNSTDVQLTRAARLTSGAYGEGYHLLRRALAAPDLRSYGLRTEGDRPLATLGYRDDTVAPARTLLLLIDPRTHELQVVRELRDGSGQTSPRDLWRVELQETLELPVPGTMPAWTGPPVSSNRLIDPACPGLREEQVISLRVLASRARNVHIPLPLPAKITRAIAIGSAASTFYDGGQDTSNAEVVLLSDDGWLQIKPASQWTASNNRGDTAAWSVEVTETPAGYLAAKVWKGLDGQPMSRSTPPIEMLAKGWTRDELMDVAHSLQPLNRTAWAALSDVFVDPKPLSADVQQMLMQAQQALALPRDGVIHAVVDYSIRTADDQPAFDDPYYIPREIHAPGRFVSEQWLELKDSALMRSKHTKTTPDGTVLNFHSIDTVRAESYDAVMGLAQRHSWRENEQSFYVPDADQFLGIDAARRLLMWSASITMTMEGSHVRFQQVLPSAPGHMIPALMSFPYGEDLVAGGWSADLHGGYIVQQIWLDRETLLLDRWSVTHVGEGQGTTAILTPLWTITLLEFRVLNTVNDDIFLPPPLPQDTMIVEETPYGLEFVNNSFNPWPPSRALVWPEGSGIEVQYDRDYRSMYDAPQAWDPSFRGFLYGGIEHLSSTGWVKFTRYRLPEPAASITVMQGSVDLLRYALRQSYGVSTTIIERSSEPVDVTVAGAQRTAWLLRADGQQALVIEIDEVAMYITGPEEYLRGMLLEHLPALEWVDVPQRSSDAVRDVAP